jgi:hypothetical protein
VKGRPAKPGEVAEAEAEDDNSETESEDDEVRLVSLCLLPFAFWFNDSTKS